jgi:hypothetical protein
MSDCVEDARKALQAFKAAKKSFKKDECLRSLKASIQAAKPNESFRWDVWKCVFENEPKGYRFLFLEEQRAIATDSKKNADECPACLPLIGGTAHALLSRALEVERHPGYECLLEQSAAIWNEVFGSEPDFLEGLEDTNAIIKKYDPETAETLARHFPKAKPK